MFSAGPLRQRICGSAMNVGNRFGPRREQDGGVTFRLWAPAASKVQLIGDVCVNLDPSGEGWFECGVPAAASGFRYGFRIDDGIEVPDPASHFQPEDVGGRSELIDHSYAWRCPEWRGRRWEEAVILELHVGTFTPEGTFRSIIDKLDHIVATGITAIELMPLADFPGRWNWGYDGVLLFAPDSTYGRPDDLRALVDAAHSRGLMVFLDVVYNHFGPEGNYLGQYAPTFFTSRHQTPWGASIDYSVQPVQDFAIENALHWLTRYQFDGLRLDAVHAIAERGEPSILSALSNAVGELATATGRSIHLILENDDNRASMLDSATLVPHGKYRAQWNDDFHHAWHVLLTGEEDGYYADYAEKPRQLIGRALSEGFVYQGAPSAHRGNAPRGEQSRGLPPAAFVNFLQNHDQIGNRAYGERLTALAPPEAVEAALAVMLLAPSPPLLFMGEEWGATEPFPFFCDFGGDLAEAVRNGRKAEFKAQFADAAATPPPDPIAMETFKSAVLNWADLTSEPHSKRLALVRDLLIVRKEHVVPRIPLIISGGAHGSIEADILFVHWEITGGERLCLAANLSSESRACDHNQEVRRPIWGGPPSQRLLPWAVHWWLGRR
jgi:maltooligosyltrehalose trehalohydrolase